MSSALYTVLVQLMVGIGIDSVGSSGTHSF